jgi:hypothetical protein
MIVARQESRSPVLIAARVAGSLAASAAAASTLRPAATNPIESIDPEAAGRELSDMAQTMVHIDPGPRGVLLLVPAGVLRHPKRLHRRGRVDHLLRAIHLAGQVHHAMNSAPAWASSKASRISVRGDHRQLATSGDRKYRLGPHC